MLRGSKLLGISGSGRKLRTKERLRRKRRVEQGERGEKIVKAEMIVVVVLCGERFCRLLPMVATFHDKMHGKYKENISNGIFK